MVTLKLASWLASVLTTIRRPGIVLGRLAEKHCPHSFLYELIPPISKGLWCLNSQCCVKGEVCRLELLGETIW